MREIELINSVLFLSTFASSAGLGLAVLLIKLLGAYRIAYATQVILALLCCGGYYVAPMLLPQILILGLIVQAIAFIPELVSFCVDHNPFRS